MRRLLLLYIACILLPFAIPKSRAFITQQAENPHPMVQAFIEASVGRGQLATRAIIQTVRSQGVTFVGGKTTITSSSGKTTELDTSDNWSLDHGCSLSGDEVEAVLKAYNSPAVGQGVGDLSVAACKEYGIDNAYWLAMFIHESTAGSAAGWAGNKGNGQYTANTGNIIGSYNGKQFGRFRDYDGDWKTGTQQHIQLLACYQSGGAESFCDGLYRGKAHADIVDAIATWAPAEDNNNPASYANAVKKDVSNWRAAHTTVATSSDSDLRAKVIELALSRRGDPYVMGARGAGASDCSGFVQYVYKTATGINPGSTTFDQWPNLEHIEQGQLRNGDLWYGRWNASGSWDSEHTGIVADVDGDGKWDLIHNGWDKSEVHVTPDFLSTDLANRTLGFATVLGDK